MVLGMFGGGSAADVNTLIARKNYGKAIEIIKSQLAGRRNDPRLRMQLADVLTLAGGGKDAVHVLLPLADEFAREGFAAKAIAVLKKVEKIEPGRRDVETRLASLIKQPRTETRSLPLVPPPASLEIGMEEIGIGMASVSTPAAPAVPDFDSEFKQEGAAPGGSAMTEQAFREGILDALGSALQSTSPADAAAEEAAGVAAGNAAAPVKANSPLFEEFTHDELVEVIHGLQLLTFAPGDIVITQDEPGASLFVLTSGIAKAFVRNPAGKHIFVRELREGDFFGEISILSGRPRTATITAGTDCELLELDRTTLDSIAQTKPRVWDVLKDFAKLRENSARDRRIRGGS